MFTVEFFGNLGIIGWLGLALWFVIPVIMIITNGDYSKNFWFRDFDDRIPNLDLFTNIFAEWGEAGQITWLVLRLIIMQVILMAIGLIMMQF